MSPIQEKVASCLSSGGMLPTGITALPCFPFVLSPLKEIKRQSIVRSIFGRQKQEWLLSLAFCIKGILKVRNLWPIPIFK